MLFPLYLCSSLYLTLFFSVLNMVNPKSIYSTLLMAGGYIFMANIVVHETALQSNTRLSRLCHIYL